MLRLRSFLYKEINGIPNLCSFLKVYGLKVSSVQNDPTLEIYRKDLVICAAKALDKAHMIRFSQDTGYLHITGNFFFHSSSLLLFFLNILQLVEAINSTEVIVC